MNTPVTIGKNSSGEDKRIDLHQSGVLFISYISDAQFYSIVNQIGTSDNNMYILTQKGVDLCRIEIEKHRVYIKDDPLKGNILSQRVLFKEILKDIKKKKQKTVKQKKNSVGLQFLVIDNIWDVLISKKKNLALELMLIIIHGPSAGYHTIIGSSLSYRNLLEQVIAMHPMLIKEIESQFDAPVPKRIDEICDELIYTPDDLVYYKKANSFVLDKYYKI
jgi:hypothetical protein